MLVLQFVSVEATLFCQNVADIYNLSNYWIICRCLGLMLTSRNLWPLNNFKYR